MGQELRVDEDRLQAVAREYDAIADEVRRAYDELQAVMAEEGNFWGDDDTGRAFAETYEPDSRALMESMKQTLAALSGQRAELNGVLANLDAMDGAGKNLVHNAVPDSDPQAGTVPPGLGLPSATTLDQAGAPPAVAVPHAATPSGASTPSRTVVPSEMPTEPGGVPGKGSGADRAGGEPPTESSPAVSSDGAPTTASGGPLNMLTPATGSSQPTSGALPPGAAASPAPENSEAKSPKAAGNPPAADRAATPWSRSANGTGRSVPASPGRVSAPSTRPGDRAARPNSPGSKTPHGPNIRKPVPGSPSRGGRDEKRDKRRLAAPDEAREMAEVLAARHGLRVLGFETPGIDLENLREIARALDDVLARHPYLMLPEFAIADCGAQVAKLDRVPSGGKQEKVPRVARLNLNSEVAKNIGLLAGTIPAEYENRPLYFTIVRELGHVLDITGGLRARSMSQRRLISEYFAAREDNRLEIPLGAIVGDYRRWRGQLRVVPAAGFDAGVALADAFAEVQMKMEEASAPAQVLQRLLVETAERYSSKESVPRPG